MKNMEYRHLKAGILGGNGMKQKKYICKYILTNIRIYFNINNVIIQILIFIQDTKYFIFEYSKICAHPWCTRCIVHLSVSSTGSSPYN